jgi:DNA repair protein RecO (recombination protein O)
MLFTTEAIVLRTIQHGDSTLILKAWTERSGLRSYLVRSGSRRGAAKAALQALNRLELVVDEKPERDLHSVRELRVSRPYSRLHTDPIRAAVALFVQEVLYKVLREEAADDGLNTFLNEMLEALDTETDISHFPLVFLLQLSGHLGFFPEAPGPGEDRFDLREGHFIRGNGEHAHTLGPPLSLALADLLEVDLKNMQQASVPASQRRVLLDHILLYYRMHLEGLGELRSPAVLHQVLG